MICRFAWRANSGIAVAASCSGTLTEASDPKRQCDGLRECVAVSPRRCLLHRSPLCYLSGATDTFAPRITLTYNGRERRFRHLPSKIIFGFLVALRELACHLPFVRERPAWLPLRSRRRGG